MSFSLTCVLVIKSYNTSIVHTCKSIDKHHSYKQSKRLINTSICSFFIVSSLPSSCIPDNQSCQGEFCKIDDVQCSLFYSSTQLHYITCTHLMLWSIPVPFCISYFSMRGCETSNTFRDRAL